MWNCIDHAIFLNHTLAYFHFVCALYKKNIVSEENLTLCAIFVISHEHCLTLIGVGFASVDQLCVPAVDFAMARYPPNSHHNGIL